MWEGKGVKDINMKPSDLSFNFEHDLEIGAYIQFYYTLDDYSEDLWDELEIFLESEFGDKLSRLEESSYELQECDIEHVRRNLIKLGLKEVK